MSRQKPPLSFLHGPFKLCAWYVRMYDDDDARARELSVVVVDIGKKDKVDDSNLVNLAKSPAASDF